jgi:hypothetical protein
MISRIAFPLLVLAAAGCSGPDVTDPRGHDIQRGVRASVDQSSRDAPVEVAFEKWFTTYPAMTGNTSYGAGTFAGTILRRTAFSNGVIVQLEARYAVTDPSDAGHSFTALIEGQENLVTRNAVLNGVVTEGAMTGARVHVTFEVITPCDLAIGPSVKGTCFQGTIRVQAQE